MSQYLKSEAECYHGKLFPPTLAVEQCIILDSLKCIADIQHPYAFTVKLLFLKKRYATQSEEWDSEQKEKEKEVPRLEFQMTPARIK